MSAAAPVRESVALTIGRGVARALGNALLVVVMVYLLWILVVGLVDNPFVAKGPGDVAEYLITGDDAAQHRSEVMEQLMVTLRDAAIGFTAGMLAAILLAGAIVLSRGVESTVMPVAMILRAVPLIALAPVIRLIFGRGISTVAVMSGIVVLFPALVGIVFGLRSSSKQMHDVVQVYGGSERDVLFKVSFPSALPSLFAAIRISVPGAITGALIAEWLATGKGIGYAVVSAAGQSKNNEVWALVIVVTLVSLLLYTLAQVLETFVLARYGKDAGRA
ncbi:ABC transporter permease [Aeromicrobium senzhongii]|nr:ABC transporter permease subunit [Aeromicrobium senzhongii]